VEGTGILRPGVLRVGTRDHVIDLACVSDAGVGGRVVAHSGHGVKVVELESLDVGERAGIGGEAETLIDDGGIGVAHLVDLEGGPIESGSI